MTADGLIDIVLKYKGAYADFPFGERFFVAKVGGRIFAQVFSLKGIPTATLNCTADTGDYYRHKYSDVVTRGYHCPPVQQPYFNSFAIEKIPDEVILEMVELSYRTVLSKLPKKIQKELL